MNPRFSISICLALSVLIEAPALGNPTPRCITQSGTSICVQFDNLSNQPELNTDFEVIFNGSVPSVNLITGRNGPNNTGTLYQWRIWSKFEGTETPANVGTIGGVTNYDFDVKIVNATGGQGAATVGSVTLTPGNGNSAYYSDLTAGNFNSLTGSLTLQESACAHGAVGNVTINSIASGCTVSIPRVADNSLFTISSVASGATVNIDEIGQTDYTNGHTFTLWNVAAGATVTIGTILNSAAVIDIPDSVAIGTIAGTVTIGETYNVRLGVGPVAPSGALHFGEIEGYSVVDLSNSHNGSGPVTIEQLGDVESLFTLGGSVLHIYCGDCGAYGASPQSDLQLAVGSLIAGSYITHHNGLGPDSTLTVDQLTDPDIEGDGVVIEAGVVDGTINLGNGLPAGAQLHASKLTSTALIDLHDANVSGTLTIDGANAGQVRNGGEITASGFVFLSSNDNQSETFTGSATFGRLSGTLLAGKGEQAVDNTGSLTFTGDISGAVDIYGNVKTGTIDVQGKIGSGGLVQLRGELTGAITVEKGLDPVATGGTYPGRVLVHGSMSGNGKIDVSGQNAGTIQVYGSTGNMTLIQSRGGLASTGLITVGTSSSASVGGTILLGTSLSDLPYILPFDGAVRVNCTQTPGSFSGLIKTIGCAATQNHSADICIHGTNTGQVRFNAQLCDYHFTRVCASCP